MRPFVLLTLALGAALFSGAAQAAPSVPIGEQSPLDFTLRSAEYSTGRVVIGNAVYFPAASEKLLILHATVHSPQQQEQRHSWADVKFTSVDAQDRNHDFVQTVAREGTSEPLEVKLRPAQKVEVMTVIRVPAAGPVSKLSVQHSGDGRVLGHDLRGEVEKLSAASADPGEASGEEAKARFSFELPLEVAADTRADSSGRGYTYDVNSAR